MRLDNTLGFDFDWSGLISTVTNAGANIALAKSKIDAQTAIAKAQLAAQSTAMQQAQLASQAGYTGPMVAPTPGAILQQIPGYVAPSTVPPWLIPAAIGVGVLAIVVLSRR